MQQHRFSKRSIRNLVGVDPRLALIASRALLYSPVDFGITSGVRTLDQQRQLLAEGATWTLKSKHLDGLAIDVVAFVGGSPSWEFEHYQQIAEAFKRAAAELGYQITWGGDWATVKDGPHFELVGGAL